MKKTKKMKVKIGLFFIMGLLLCLLGFTFGKMSDSYKGTSMLTGRMVDGKFVANSASSSVTIGGNLEGVEQYKNYSLIAYGIGAAFIIGGIVDGAGYMIGKKNSARTKNN